MRLRFTDSMMLALVLAGTVACGQDRPNDRMPEATRDSADAVEDAGRDSADAVREAGRDSADAVREAGRDTVDAVEDAAQRAGAAVETADVKLALTMDSSIDSSNINVDTDHASKTVTLKGWVPTATQRTQAEVVATRRAAAYRIVNQLDVRGI